MKQKSLGEVELEEKERECPECGGELEYQDGEFVCKKCGLVVE